MSATATRSRARVTGLIAAVAVVVAIALRSEILDLGLTAVCTLTAVTALVALWAVVSLSRRGLWSAASAYLVVFVLFHFGLAILVALRLSPPDYMAEYLRSWFNDEGSVREALYLSMLASGCLVAGCSWMGGRDPVGPIDRTHPALRSASRLGVALVTVGAGVLLWWVATTIPELLLGAGGRTAYWAAVEGSAAAVVAQPLLIFGGILLAIGRPGWARRVGFVALGLFGIWALLVGARTAIMYTALAMVVVLARRRRMPSTRVAVVALLGGLLVVGFVGQARLDGEYASRASIDPRVGLAEMGGSLRSVVEVVEYRRVNHVPLMNGVTYVGFAARGAEALLGLPRPDGLTDPRIAGNEFRGRLDNYQIGYSSVAEAFRNGDTGGVVVVFLVIGSLLGYLDSRRLGRPYADFTVGAVFYVLAFTIRQPSVSSIANLSIAAGVLLLWRIWTAIEDHGSPAAGPTASRLTGVGGDRALANGSAGHPDGPYDGKIDVPDSAMWSFRRW